MHATDFKVRPANRADLYGVLVVQLDAFGRVAQMHSIPKTQLPPLNEPLDALEALYDAGTRFWVAESSDGHVVGSVRADMREDGAVEIGRLVVAHGHLRKGIASALMDALEAGYPLASRFELFTGRDADAPLQLYQKRGYRITREEQTPAVTLVWLEKSNLASP